MAHGQQPHRTEGDHDPDDFGPLTRRQAENLAHFTIRLSESLQYEKLGRAVAAKALLLVGVLGLALWTTLTPSPRLDGLLHLLLK